MRNADPQLMRWINVGVILLTLLSYLAPITDPNAFWPLAFMGLIFPLLLFANILFILWWAFRRHWYAFFSVGCLLVGWSHVQGALELRFGGALKPGTAKDALTFMTFNAHEFKGIGKQRFDQQTFADLIRAQKPDVLCFQEFPLDAGSAKRYADLLSETGSLRYSYQEKGGTLAIFSRYPIGRKGANYFTNRANGFLFADLDINGKSVRVFNVHLQTNAISKITEKIDPADVNLQDRETWQSFEGVLRRYKRSAQTRARQAIAIAEAIKKSPFPTFVCGDFNDVPMSFSTHTIAEGLQDAFKCKGSGRGVTYAGNIPGLRIDYLLAGSDFEVLDFQTLRPRLSDHYPLVTRVVAKF